MAGNTQPPPGLKARLSGPGLIAIAKLAMPLVQVTAEGDGEQRVVWESSVGEQCGVWVRGALVLWCTRGELLCTKAAPRPPHAHLHIYSARSHLEDLCICNGHRVARYRGAVERIHSWSGFIRGADSFMERILTR